jgi:nitroreductase/YHS domain-containing protein
MDHFEGIAKRHSYRGGFTDAPVPREDLIKIVQAGIQAPSGKNEQVVSFVIVDHPELLRQVAAIVDRPICTGAKALIVCVIDPRPVMEGISFAAEDCAAAVENMLLAITALGYASVWLDGVLRFENKAARIAHLLGVPDTKTVRVLLPVGVAAEPGCQKEKPAVQQPAKQGEKVAMHEHAATDQAPVQAVAGEQTTCPVMGGPINKDIFVEYQGKKVYFCCKDCPEVFKADPAKYIAKLPQFAK